jgi:hypothetical protein
MYFIKRIDVISTKKKYVTIFSKELVAKCLSEALKVNQYLYDKSAILERDPTPIRDPNEYEYYVGACSFSISHLLTLLEQLVIIPAYLLEYGQTKSMKKYSINRLMDISYHVENFIIRAKSVDDYLLQVYNSIFHLGNSLANVNYNVIINNAHLTSTDVLLQIKKVHKVCEEYSSERNKIIHQHSMIDIDLRKIELMLRLSRSDSDYKSGARMQYIYNINRYIEYKVPEMEVFTNELLDEINILFDQLLVVYDKNRNKLIK